LESCTFDVGQDPPRPWEQRLTRWGQPDVAPRPTEQPGPELALQRVNLFAQRRLRDKHGLGRAREVTSVSDRSEVLELAKLHVNSV